jgi:Calx-beta domain/Right handed beta helix region
MLAPVLFRSRARLARRSLPTLIALAAFLLLSTIAGAARAIVYPCTEDGVDKALTLGGTATFSCAAPTTIVVSAPKTIRTNGTNLDGGGRLILSGGNALRPLTVAANVTATVSNITLEGGSASDYGGNLLVQGTLTLENSTIRNGSAFSGGGGIWVAGTGTLNANGCTVHDNTAGAEGAVAVHGKATLRNTTITNNSLRGVAARFGGTATLDHCTIVTPSGEAIFLSGSATDTVTVSHSLLIAPPGTSSIGGPGGTALSQGYNMLSNAGGITLLGDATGNQLGVTPLLGPLADNGGPTKTRALLACSPGINAGATTGGGSIDQRGQTRLRNGARDIGAYESDLTPCLSIDDASANEGSAGATSLVFPVKLSGASTLPVSVSYAFADGTATFADGDYAAAPGTLTFPPGTTSGSVNLLILGDQRFEADETLSVNLSAPTNATFGDASATGTIRNDDPIPAISISDVTVVEGSGGTTTAELTVALSAASSQTVTVKFATANGTASAGSDYTSASGTLTFNPGIITQKISVAVAADTLFEGDETFTVALSAATNATLADATGIVTIKDDETTPGIAIGNVSIAEGNAGTKGVSLTVTLTNGSATPVSVSWATVDGTATTADADYTNATGVLTFAPGETSKTIEVQISGDTRHEATETFVVQLSNAAGATIASATGTATITNDDPVPTISVAVLAAVTEGNSGDVDATFVVSLSNPTTETVTVQYATSDVTATAGDDDYTPASGSLTFAPGELEHDVTAHVHGDVRFEADETFAFTLSLPANATLAAAQAFATIENDDVAPTSDGGADAGGKDASVDADGVADAGPDGTTDPDVEPGPDLGIDAGSGGEAPPSDASGGCAVVGGDTAHHHIALSVVSLALIMAAVVVRRRGRNAA